MPNGPEERALRALAARHSDAELPALLRAAFEPSYPSYASLARLDRGGAGAVNELRAKAKRLATTGPPAKGRASNADKDWDGAAVKTITTQHGEEWTFDDEHR